MIRKCPSSLVKQLREFLAARLQRSLLVERNLEYSHLTLLIRVLAFSWLPRERCGGDGRKKPACSYTLHRRSCIRLTFLFFVPRMKNGLSICQSGIDVGPRGAFLYLVSRSASIWRIGVLHVWYGIQSQSETASSERSSIAAIFLLRFC